MISVEELKLYLKDLPNQITEPIDVKRAKRDFFYFVKSYFPHHIEFATKEKSIFRRFIYKEIDKLLKNNKEILFTAYRGGAKTTLISNLFILWKIIKQENRFIIIISSSESLAKDIFDLINEEINSNEIFKRDFNIEIVKSLTTEIVIRVDDFLLKIAAYGAGAKIRGKRFLSFRPDLISLDDIENDENVQNKNQRNKLYSWYKKVVKKLPSRTKKYNIIIVGTILHHDSLLARLKNEVDFYRNFPLVIDFKNWKLDNPDINLNEVKKEFNEDKESFLQEYQNIPLSKDALIFNHYKTFEVAPKCDFYSIAIDPAMGKKNGDYFAIAILGYKREEKKFYLTAKGYKRNPTDMIKEIIRIYIKYSKISRTTFVIETIAYQEFFKDVFKKASQESGIFIPIKEFKNRVPKEIRINSIAPLVKDETILIDEDSYLLVDELDTYPKSPHDDLLDASEMAKRAFDINGGVDYKAVKSAIKNFSFKTMKYGF